MEGFRVFSPEEWEAAGVDGTTLAVNDLKETLEGLAKRLFGEIVCIYLSWMLFLFTNTLSLCIRFA